MYNIKKGSENSRVTFFRSPGPVTKVLGKLTQDEMEALHKSGHPDIEKTAKK